MPAKYRDRAPRMDHLEQGDAWIFEGWDGPINFGFNASAGLPPERRTPWIRWEDVPRYVYDPAARLQMGNLARRAVEDRYNWEAQAQGLLELYASLTARTGGRGPS